MDNRKRSAVFEQDELAPPLKKVATNGSKGQSDGDQPTWTADVERYQKEAILRQMREYKREKGLLEAQLADSQNRSTFHDDHLRIIDAWFTQVIDEIEVLVSANISTDTASQAGTLPFASSLLFAEGSEQFEQHLRSRSDEIKSAISRLFGNLPAAAPEVRQLQERISSLLAVEKVHGVQLHRAIAEKEQIQKRLEDASYRYMVAEKKLDRAKSATVQKMESQAIKGGPSKAGSGLGSEPIKTEAVAEVNGSPEGVELSAEVEAARKEAVATSTKRKEQLERLEAENKKLSDELTALTVKTSRFTDDDYAKSELFKLVKLKHEDVIKRINHMEAKNTQLREEVEKFQAERTAYRVQLENESRATISDVESQIARAESDLARIRNSRDDLLAEISQLKTAEGQRKSSQDQTKEYVGAMENRIAALESELERLRIRLGESQGTTDTVPDVENMSLEDLQTKVRSLEKEYALLSNELPSMEAAWKKASALAAKKVSDVTASEEQASRLTAEKAKADQKYFAAMKAKEAKDGEIRVLKAQNSKSSEIVMQLKEAEASSRTFTINLEKQLAESKEVLNNVSSQVRALQQKLNEAAITSEDHLAQVNELRKALSAKDASSVEAAKLQRQAEAEVEALKVRLGENQKSLEGWKKKGLGNQSDEYDALRTIAICTVCRKNFKNTALKTCGHVFCKECVDERITARSRKCPNCGKSFGSNDHMRVTL